MTSFVVNKHDLEFILKQIEIAELHSSTPGMTTSQAIQQIYGLSPLNAALNPLGLRTVDGRDNNLIPGQEDFGAADTLFPRLLDPVDYNNEGDEGLGYYGVTNTDYGIGGNVVDSDPRIISNLISDQTVSNPAAILAALKSLGTEGTEANDAQAAISSAYNNTKLANGFNAQVTAAQTTLTNANTAEAQAIAVNNEVMAKHAAYVAANLLADDATNSAAAVPAKLQALANAIAALEAPEAAVASAYSTLATLEAEEVAANSTKAAAEAALIAAGADADPSLRDAVESATAEADAAQLAKTDQLNTIGIREADLKLAQDAADAAYNAADEAVALAGTDASAVVAALRPLGFNFDTRGALAAQGEAADLSSALDTLALDGVSFADASALAEAAAAFDATAAAVSENAFPALISAAEAELAPSAEALAAANAAQDRAEAAFNAAALAAGTTGTPEQTAKVLADLLEEYGIEVGADGALFIQNISPDVGLSPSFNTVMTIFGQFFDHGLDLVTKGGNGTVLIPLAADDPMIAGKDGLFGTADDLPQQLRFMALTRATPTMVDGVAQHENTTTPFVDQNQTYTSNPSHQAFLREYVRLDLGDGAKTYSTGRLLDGQTANGSMNGAPGNWAETKANALEFLGIRLNDFDVHSAPLLATDAYGNLKLGANGYAQMVMKADAAHGNQPWLKEGTAEGITTEGAMTTGHQFLADIAHHAAPGFYDTNRDQIPDTVQTADLDPGVGDDRNPATYDDEMLNSHFVTGDGRGNENIALTAIHAVFHSEHNRTFEANKATILATKDLAFINEWLLVGVDEVPQSVDDVIWDGARLFQAARFSTEMQYQHMVFEEFARRVQPAIDPFVFTNTADVDPSILAEFAHAVYRFGHSMLNSSVDRFDNNLNLVNGEAEQISLIEAFLNPQAFLGGGNNLDEVQGALFRGMTRDAGNAIDEFVVDALRSNLLGLPLDLPALNIARARETGTPTLQEARQQLYNDFGLADLKPYTGWNDFVQNIKTPLSVINFIAAYGTHASITSATTLAEKREAATLLVLGDGTNADGVTIRGTTYTASDRSAFLNGTDAYAADNGGLNNVDLWIGGLAELNPEFGGMLGTTFNFIFEYQMENLQNADRFYYLSRTQGLNLLNQLEPNTFADIVMRNSDLGDDFATHMSGQLFLTPDHIIELDKNIAQEDYNGAGDGRDPEHSDRVLQSIDPKVVRIDSGVMRDGHQFGGELRFRGGEHVVLGGTEGNDTLIADIGDDSLWGDGGDDYVNGGQGADHVFGGRGDDVIEDPFGENFLRGEQGNDVISSARGLNLLFGGEGKDVLLLGQDGSEVFAGEGDDFILGGAGGDFLLGNEGDDWIEGGEGFDGIAGDNSELFFNSSIIGHDVAWGQGNDQDYDLESGDDIALNGPGIERFEGMFGFDWAIGKHDIAGMTADTLLKPENDIDNLNRDRFDLMEAVSGWTFDDILRGDERGSAVVEGDPNQEFDDHVLSNEGIDRIEGMREWIDDARLTLFGDADASYRDGNILMGGDGNDTMEGRGGFDLIDGDAWLNVRIRIVVNGTEYSAESLNSAANVAGPNAGKVFNLDANGRPDFNSPAFEGRALTSLLLDRTINPGQMSIVREIRYDRTPVDNTDVAVYRGAFSDYAIEGRGHETPGNIWNSFDLNGDGFIQITDLTAIGDDTDLLKNIEVVRFTDGDVIINGSTPVVIDIGADITFTGVLPVQNNLPLAGEVIGQLTSSVAGVTFSKVSGANIDVSSSGVVSVSQSLAQNSTIVLDVQATNQTGSSAERIAIIAGSNAANNLSAIGTDDTTIYARGGNDTVTGGFGSDTLYGQLGTDTLNGGAGNDTLVGGLQGDIINGGAGDDLILHPWGDGFDTINGGADFDTVVITGNALNQNLSVVYAGGVISSIANVGSFANIEAIRADMGGSADRLSYTATSNVVVVDLSAGTASGFASIANIRDVNGTNGADTVTTGAQENQVRTGNGNDTIIVTVDDAADLAIGGGGSDTVDYSAYTTNLSVVLQGTISVVGGSGSSAATSDSLQTIENFIGGSGNDSISGTAGVNTLVGGGGNDVLSGLRGVDILTGGDGNDTFVFRATNETLVTNSDVITDFQGAGAALEDIIDLSGFAGVFSFVGTSGFNTGNQNQVRYEQTGTDTLLHIDTDGDIGSEARIRLTGLHALTANDLML